MAYIQYDERIERIEIFSKIKDFYNNNYKYIRIIKYYKSMTKNSYLNYDQLTQKEYLNRTNNLLENFFTY